jgi:hypothetical protein
MGSPLDGATRMAGLFDSRYFELAAGNGEVYRIFIGGPLSSFVAGPEGAARKHPVVYVLDGKLNFAMVHAQVQTLSALNQLPPAYVVGIGYAGDESFFQKDVLLRMGDLTPDKGGAYEAAMLELNDAQISSAKIGRAASFLAFLVEELKPLLEASLPIEAGDTTIVGNSLSGLFPTWVLLHAPESFQRYVIISPAWWWNGYEVWEWEEHYAKVHKRLPCKVFVGAGGLEIADKHRVNILRMQEFVSDPDARERFSRYIALANSIGWPEMAELLPRFAKLMRRRNYRDCTWTVMNFPEETHESIPGPGFSRGLRFVFDSWKPRDGASS